MSTAETQAAAPAAPPALTEDEQFMLRRIGVKGAHLTKRSTVSSSLERRGLIMLEQSLLTFPAQLTEAGRAALEECGG